MIAIVDYGLGNVKAFSTIYEKLNIPHSVVSNASDLQKATKVILPGVGAFDYAVNYLNDSGMREQLDFMVLNESVPVLGVCVGMQIMANSSEEGVESGLGWIEGKVKKMDFAEGDLRVRVPHMGWNSILPMTQNKLMIGLDDQSRFYFLHSYYFVAEHSASVLALAKYGAEFACAVFKDNIFGVQFHPEKSHGWGVRVLENFARLPSCCTHE